MKIIYDNKTKMIKFSGNVKNLLIKLKINPDVVIVAKGDILLTEKDKVVDTDTIRILSVVSGG